MESSPFVQKLARTDGYFARRIQSWQVLPEGIEIKLAAVAFRNLGDEQRPIIVSNEPLAEQTVHTNVPNRPPDMHVSDLADSFLELKLHIRVLSEQIVRLRLSQVEQAPDRQELSMLLPQALEHFSAAPLPLVQEESGKITLTIGETVITFSEDPFALCIKRADGTHTIFGTALEDRGVHGLLCTPAPGVRVGQDGKLETFWSWAIEPDEHFYGLGEHFNSFDHRGHTLRLWNQDAWGTTTEAAYKNIPFLLSSQHYGLFFHTPSPLTMQLGTPSARTAIAQSSETTLDLFVFFGKTPKELLSLYTSLTGRTTMPPAWAFGVWFSRCRYQSRVEVENVARHIREEHIPCDVLHIDPAWLRFPNLSCDFIANETAFPDLKGFVRELSKQGFHVSLWELPYLSAQSPRYQEAALAGYLLRTRDGELATIDIGTPPADGYARGLVDFINPAACSWWQNLHREWLQAGVAIFKADFGEGVPLNALAHNGMNGQELRNLYALLYNRAVHEVITQETGRPGMLWGRSGWAGIQRYPAQWGGDPKTDVWSMRSSLRGGLGFSLSAPGLWSHDIGGFYGSPPSPELYIRWAQFGLLSPLARAHGTTPREPWEFGEHALTIFKRFAQLRMRLQPYLYSTAWEMHTQGWPFLRPLLLEFPDDPGAALIDDAYLLGSQLLVAPIFSDSPEPVTRTVYLPEGDWYDFWSNEHLHGGRYHRQTVPLETIPLYVRAGTILPLGPQREQYEEGGAKEITLEVFIGTENSLHLVWNAEGNATDITLHKRDGHWQVSLTGDRVLHWQIRWHDGSRIKEQVLGNYSKALAILA